MAENILSKEQAVQIAVWMLDNDASVRSAAKHFSCAKTTINDTLNHYDLGTNEYGISINDMLMEMSKRHQRTRSSGKRGAITVSVYPECNPFVQPF